MDHSRQRKAAKRGGSDERVSIEDTVTFGPARGREIETLDDALNALAKIDARKVQIIERRFFGGFSTEETAQALSISVATVGREQRSARSISKRRSLM